MPQMHALLKFIMTHLARSTASPFVIESLLKKLRSYPDQVRTLCLRCNC